MQFKKITSKKKQLIFFWTCRGERGSEGRAAVQRERGREKEKKKWREREREGKEKKEREREARWSHCQKKKSSFAVFSSFPI